MLQGVMFEQRFAIIEDCYSNICFLHGSDNFFTWKTFDLSGVSLMVVIQTKHCYLLGCASVSSFPSVLSFKFNFYDQPALHH